MHADLSVLVGFWGCSVDFLGPIGAALHELSQRGLQLFSTSRRYIAECNIRENIRSMDIPHSYDLAATIPGGGG